MYAFLKNALLLGLITIISISCNYSASNDSAKTTNAEFADIVTSHTGGYISSQAEIKVKLTKSIVGITPGTEVADQLFKFSPGLKGKTFWEDDKTLVFQPSEGLVSGQKYEVSLLLNKIIESEKKSFPFSFECIPQNFEVKVDGLSLYNSKDLTKVKISGIIQTSDIASNEQIEAIINASQDQKSLSISFEHGLGQNKHSFIIENVTRAEKPGEVTIKWDGASIKVDKEGNISYPIPSLSDYSITSVQLVRSNPDYLSIKFSDPIDPEQNLRGAVWFSKGNNPRVVVELNELKVYPTSMLNGKVDINISKLVKNVAGFGLDSDYVSAITFSSLKPQLRLNTNAGTIMPKSEGLIIPFEAVSLNAVDLTVVEVFENNILQYFQNNDLGNGGDWNLKYVARPVVRKVISLNTSGVVDLGDWNRFTLDLSKYLDVKSGALYQVRLNFRRSYSVYGCVEQTDNIEFQDDLEFEQSKDWNDEYDDFYYYDWENRENPCSPAYYTSEKIVRKIVFASEYGIIAKKAEAGDLQVFVSDLTTTNLESDVSIAVYDYQQQKIGTGKTDAKGKTRIKVNGVPFAIVASKGEGTGYLKLNDGSALSVSNFNVGGNKIQKGIKGFIYGERGVWRPADTLHLAFMLDDVENKLPIGHPVVMEIFNPTGQLYSRQVQTASLKGLYAFKVLTKKEDPTGNWRAKVKVGGAEFYKTLKIETVKPNRLKMELAFSDDMLYAQSDNQTASLSIRWLHGAIARNLKASYEVLLAPTKTSFKGFENYNFDDPRKEFITEAKPLFDGKVNNDGKATMSFKLDAGKNAPGMLKAIFRGKAFEEGGDFSINKETINYAPYTSFVGLTVPENDRWGRLMADKDHTLQLATVDSQGNPVSRTLDVELYKISWRWWWDNSYEGSSYSSRYQTEKIKSGTASTTDGKGSYTLNIARDWGRYYIKITDSKSGHSTGKVFYLTYPGWANQVRGQLGGVTMLELTMDKEEVKVGENLTVSFPSSSGAKALVSIENGSSVINTFWAETKDGNTSVEVPITDKMAPNIFINVSLIQPHAQTANNLPMRLYGIQGIDVVNPNTVLSPVITMPNELKPSQEFIVKVKEENGKAMAYTLAIVEDGLLDLTQFKTPDSWKTFYAKEALGVKTWDVYDDVMGTYGGKIEKLLAIGGDDEIKGPDENESNRFKPVVIYKGPFFLKAGEEQALKLKMPEYIGSVRAMVVAGYEKTYGKAEKTVPVKQPLMALATLPRVAGPNEEITLPVNIFVLDKVIKDVEVSVSVDGNLSLVGSGKTRLSFNEPGDQMAYFKLKAAPSLGSAKVVVTAKSGSNTANFTVDLTVRAANPEITQVEESVIQGGESWSVKYSPIGISSTNESALEISSLPPLNLEQRMQYLIRYPHGCIEQTTSSVFAQLYLDDLVDLSEARAEEVQFNINEAIKRLRKFQLPSGAFSYWPGSSQPSFWGTNYAGHFLLEAKKQGYLVPEDILKKWTDFQLNEANRWTNKYYNDYLTQAYRLYVLSVADKPALGAMNRLKADNSISNRARWSLASAYANLGQEKAANEIIEGLTTESKPYRELGGTYGSMERDIAMILETMIKLNRESDAFELVKQLSGFMSNSNRWMSTQTTAYCLVAISAFVQHYPPGSGVNVNVKIANNDFRVDGSKYINQITIIEPDKPASIEVMNNGSSPLFIKLIRTGVPVEGLEAAAQSNLKLGITYTTVSGSNLDPNNIEQGTDFMAKVTVSNPGLRGNYEELALTQIFPSGWEILNTRLDDTDQFVKESESEYKDIRDDRVMTYFDLNANSTKTFVVRLNASYLGKYYLPALQVEAMYDNSIAANTAGQWVEVVSQQ